MRLPSPLLPVMLVRRADILGILFVAVVLAVVLYISVRPQQHSGKGVAGGGFGPDWDCQYVPSGEDVCIRDVGGRRSD